MPTVNGKKFAYTPEGMRAAAKAKRAKVQGNVPQPKPNVPRPTPMAKNPDEVKTKADLLAGNLGGTIKNMGGGY